MKYLISFLFILTFINYKAINESKVDRAPASRFLKKTCYYLVEGITNRDFNKKKKYEELFSKKISSTNNKSMNDSRISNIKDHIHSLFENANDEEQSLNEALNYLIDQELKLHPPKIRERITKILHNASYISDHNFIKDPFLKSYIKGKPRLEKTEFYAFIYHEKRSLIGDAKVVVKVPKEYRGSALEKILASHEIFHAIQIEKIRDDYPDLSDTEINSFLSTLKAKYALEYGAMAFEWKYIHTLPKDIKEKLLKDFEADYPTQTSDNRLLKRLLSSEFESGEEHVKNEHMWSRYSKVDLGNEYALEIAPRTKLIALAATNATIYSFFYLVHKCEKEKEAGLQTNFRKYICGPLLFE